ncbi:hypothetical protein ES705_43854 [subsurface metagenome]
MRPTSHLNVCCHRISNTINHGHSVTLTISTIHLIIGRIIDQSPGINSYRDGRYHRICCAVNYGNSVIDSISVINLVIGWVPAYCMNG